MKRKTYRICEDKRDLIYECKMDEDGNVIYSKDYLANPVLEIYEHIDSRKKTNTHIEVIDGVESDRSVTQFNEEGEVLEYQQFIGGELYEKIMYERSPQREIETTYQDYEEVRKTIRDNLENGKAIVKTFSFNELIETQLIEFDEAERKLQTKIFDESNNLLEIICEMFDEQERLIRTQNLNSRGETIAESLHVWENDLLIKEEFKEHSNEDYINSYSYDENENLIKTEVRSISGKVLEFHNQMFDENNRLIEENGYLLHGIVAPYGGYFVQKGFQLEHEWEE